MNHFYYFFILFSIFFKCCDSDFIDESHLVKPVVLQNVLLDFERRLVCLSRSSKSLLDLHGTQFKLLFDDEQSRLWTLKNDCQEHRGDTKKLDFGLQNNYCGETLETAVAFYSDVDDPEVVENECNSYRSLLFPLLLASDKADTLTSSEKSLILLTSPRICDQLSQYPLHKAFATTLVDEMRCGLNDSSERPRRLCVERLVLVRMANSHTRINDHHATRHLLSYETQDDFNLLQLFKRVILEETGAKDANQEALDAFRKRNVVSEQRRANKFVGLKPGGGAHNLAEPVYCGEGECEAWREQQLMNNNLNSIDDDDSIARRRTVEVLMLYDSKQRRWADRLAVLNRAFATKVGWSFRVYNTTLDKDRATAWSKVIAIQNSIE